MKYKVVIDNWTSGLNELLNHQEKRYDPRTKRMRVYNTEKVKNERKIRSCLQKQGLDKVKLKTPIAIHYKIYAKDKKHDRMNLGSCLDKCFCDALQTMKILSNDGFDDVVEIRFDYGLDRSDPRAEITITEMQRVEKES